MSLPMAAGTGSRRGAWGMRAAGQLALLGAACLSCRPVGAQHAWYNFDTPRHNFSTFTSYLRWTQAEKGDVYLATQFFTGCSGGYFGGQLHSDGSHMVLFSMWDFNATAKTARGVSPWCTRFGSEGEGAHCGLEYFFEFGVEYRFELSKASNASGALWSASVTEMGVHGDEGASTFLGTIFIDARALPGDCAQLQPSAVSFQEYYLGGSFYSAADWRGPFLDGDHGTVAFDADGDCGVNATPSNVSSVVPDGPRGRPNVLFQMGGGTPHGCEKSMWQHRSGATLGDASAGQRRAFVRRPTATRPTGPAERKAVWI